MLPVKVLAQCQARGECSVRVSAHYHVGFILPHAPPSSGYELLEARNLPVSESPALPTQCLRHGFQSANESSINEETMLIPQLDFPLRDPAGCHLVSPKDVWFEV